jgi:hypothetical protein
MAAQCVVMGVGTVVGRGVDRAEPFRVVEGEGMWASMAQLWGQFDLNRRSRFVTSVNQTTQKLLMM